MKKTIMMGIMLILLLCPMTVYAAEETTTEETTEESNEDIEIEVNYVGANDVLVKHVWKYKPIIYTRRCAIFLLDYPGGYKEIYLYGQKNDGTSTIDKQEYFGEISKTAFTKKSNENDYKQTGYSESSKYLFSNTKYYKPGEIISNNGYTTLISGYSINSRNINVSVMNNSKIPIFTVRIPEDMNGLSFDEYITPEFESMCVYLDTGIKAEAPVIKNVKYLIDDAGVNQSFDVKVQSQNLEHIMIKQKMTYHCFNSFKYGLLKANRGEFISPTIEKEFRFDRTNFGGGGDSHLTESSGSTEDNIYHQSLKLTGNRSISSFLEDEYDKFLNNILLSMYADFAQGVQFQDNRFFSKSQIMDIIFIRETGENAGITCNVTDRYVDLEYTACVIDEAGHVIAESKPYTLKYDIETKKQYVDEPDPDEPTEEPTTQEGSTIEYKDGKGINIVINNNPTFNNQNGNGGTGTGNDKPSFFEKLFDSLNEFWMGICTLINNVTSSILKIINDSWEDFTKLFDEIMDSLKSGFGLLGEDGFLSLLADVFSFIPEWIWKLFGAGIGITFLLVIIGMIVKIAT